MANKEVLYAVQTLRQTLVFGRLVISLTPGRLVVHGTTVAPNETW